MVYSAAKYCSELCEFKKKKKKKKKNAGLSYLM